ncbi:MAG: hypothetical protein E7052_06910 [Lentisphaerae bacterium]|nr:hypothetical protein [Lentisphaerota bacterium]
MKIDFRIDWGYQYLYSRRHYHPYYCWDGSLHCRNGVILETYKLDYPVIWYGPGHCARESKLPQAQWRSTTRRGMAGVRIVAEAAADAVFDLQTASGNFTFSAADILEKGRIEFPVGPKYLNCYVVVTRSKYYWSVPAQKIGQQVWEAQDLADKLPLREWARMQTVWIKPNGRLAFQANVAASPADHTEQLLHLVCMAADEYTPGQEKQVCDYFTIRLYCDGEKIAENTRFYRRHDKYMQMLEDLYFRFQVAPGVHTFEIENIHAEYHFLINRILLQNCQYQHLELSLPPWALAGEKLLGRIFAAYADSTKVSYPGGSCQLELQKGWNDFAFQINEPALNVQFRTSGGSVGVIPAVYALKDETPEVTVGYDLTVIPHDHSGTMDWLLDYTWRTRLGNLAVFRSFLYRKDQPGRYEVNDELLFHWADFCRTHNIYVEAATDFDSGALVKGAGNMLHYVGRHEWPGAVYARDPDAEWQSDDMKTAMEHYLKYLKIEVDRAHRAAPGRAAFGDASGGHRYCYMAGIDFIRSETMVPHTQHLCSQARPCAEVFRNGVWGVHIAIQHPMQPYYENHLGQYYLSLFQPWMMGANMIYEEDSLFCMFKEERQAWDDKLTKGKRDMTREFFRFVKTHPRSGRPVRKIAFIEGRYAAPFNGFICDSEQTPDYSVWGLFGKNDPAWGHRQPEKCRQLLDVLMPGACTHPLRQDFTKRRFFFSGTPYGDFDEIPAEAAAEYMQNYSLLLHLGWNTMIREDYDKLHSYVENGGTLIIALPQFSQHTRRDFLLDMEELNLWNNGDLSELCGVKVRGKGEIFSGMWNCADRMDYPEPDLSAIPSSSSEEDGSCHLAEIELTGGEAAVWDSFTGKPLIVRHQLGRGTVYLLTAYAYPGHEKLQKFMASFIAYHASKHLPECYISDHSKEVFWNMWQVSSSVRRLMLLNTDWSTAGNCKQVTVHTPEISFETTVVERRAKFLTVLENVVLESDESIHIEPLAPGRIRIHGSKVGKLYAHYRNNNVKELNINFTPRPFTDITLE